MKYGRFSMFNPFQKLIILNYFYWKDLHFCWQKCTALNMIWISHHSLCNIIQLKKICVIDLNKTTTDHLKSDNPYALTFHAYRP